MKPERAREAVVSMIKHGEECTAYDIPGRDEIRDQTIYGAIREAKEEEGTPRGLPLRSLSVKAERSAAGAARQIDMFGVEPRSTSDSAVRGPLTEVREDD